jgi:NADPH-dependent 7-cyano-7-deazaguanine reductase QueF-like protein
MRFKKEASKEKIISVLKRNIGVFNRWCVLSGREPDLRYADLSYADLRSANLSYADLRSADLRYADLSSADLRYADLSYADLRSANLSSANLRSADLRSANLRYADLRYADLSYADLRSANLSSANLDFSCMNFSCKSLKTKYDNKHIIQILYHAGKPCENNHIELDADTKKLLNSKMFKKVVNKFHRTEECGIFGGTK